MPTSSQDEHSSSDQESDAEITFYPSRQPQPVPSMFMPYIEGPKMDWTVNDGLYHRFLKWHLNCENNNSNNNNNNNDNNNNNNNTCICIALI